MAKCKALTGSAVIGLTVFLIRLSLSDFTSLVLHVVSPMLDASVGLGAVYLKWISQNFTTHCFGSHWCLVALAAHYHIVIQSYILIPVSWQSACT